MRDAGNTARTYRYTLSKLLVGRPYRDTSCLAAIAACVSAGSLSAITAATFGLFSNAAADDSVAITSGLKVLTSANNPWSAADVGKAIDVAGAGAAGATLRSRIMAYTSAGQVTLADAAGTTVTPSVSSAAGLAVWGNDHTATKTIPADSNAAGTQETADLSLSAVATGSSTLRSLADRLSETLSVLDFGAVGDGVADDTVAIQAAIQAAFAANCPLRWPFGTYRYAPAAHIQLTGTGTQGLRWIGENATIECETVDIKFFVIYTAETVEISGLTFTGPGVVGASPEESDGGVMLYGAKTVRLHNLRVSGFIGDGILVTAAYNVSAALSDSCQIVDVRDCWFDANGRGGLTVVSCGRALVENCYFGPNVMAGVPATFPGLHIEADASSTRYGIDDITVENCDIKSKVTIITNKHVAATVSDRAGWARLVRCRVVTASTTDEVAVSAVGHGNLEIAACVIDTTAFVGTPDTASGAIVAKGGTLHLRDNKITANKNTNALNLLCWPSSDGARSDLLVVGNRMTMTGAAAYLYRLSADAGTYGTKMWDQMEFRSNRYSGAATQWMRVFPYTTAFTLLCYDERVESAYTTLFSFQAEVPAGSKVLLRGCKAAATTAFDMTTGATPGAGTVRIDGGSITGALTNIADYKNVINVHTRMVIPIDGAGAPAAGYGNWPAGAPTLTKTAVGVYSICAYTNADIATTIVAHASIRTNAAGQYTAQISANGGGGGAAWKLTIYAAGVLADPPINSNIHLSFEPQTAWDDV